MGCFSTPKIDQGDQVLQNEYAEISREQFANYQKRYEPIFDKLIADSTDPNFVSNAVNESVSGVNQQFDVARKNIDVTNSNYRLQLTERQRKAQDTLLTHDRKTTIDDVSNRTRLGAADLQDGLRTSLVGIGQGVRTEALSNYGQATGMENRRGQLNLQAETNRKTGMINLLGAAAGTAGMFMLSDRTKKRDISSADTKSHLKQMVDLSLYDYDYEPGIDPEQKRRTGTMWQESQNLRAPRQDAKVLDLGDWNAKNTGAIQEMNKQMTALRKEVLKLRAA